MNAGLGIVLCQASGDQVEFDSNSCHEYNHDVLRVVMLSWEYPPRIVGGISPHVFDLSKELVKLGIEIHVVTKHTPLAVDEEVEPSGVHVHRVAGRKAPDS